MEKGKETSYFLGANTHRGFYSLYDHYINTQDGDFLWVVKGGPGCGKSSFMRHIGKAALRAGLAVEYIYCSGDPKSLDGVYIPKLRVAYVDGTAPHGSVTSGRRVDTAPVFYQNFQWILTACSPVSGSRSPISIFWISMTASSLGRVSSFRRPRAFSISSVCCRGSKRCASSSSI